MQGEDTPEQRRHDREIVEEWQRVRGAEPMAEDPNEILLLLLEYRS